METPTYTFVIRSQDRAFGDANDFRIALPFQSELAKHDYWRVSIQQAIFPKSNAYTIHYDSTANEYIQPDNNTIFTHEFLELRLDFGGACRGHDTALGGGRMSHFVTSEQIVDNVFKSKPSDAITYEIARPNLNEMHVQVVNKDGHLAKVMKRTDFPSVVQVVPGALYAAESALPEWVMTLHVQPIRKYE